MKWILLGLIFLIGCSSPPVKSASVIQALAILDEAKVSHQFYIDHPEYQTFATGNTSHNERWVNYYDDISELIIELWENQN